MFKKTYIKCIKKVLWLNSGAICAVERNEVGLNLRVCMWDHENGKKYGLYIRFFDTVLNFLITIYNNNMLFRIMIHHTNAWHSKLLSSFIWLLNQVLCNKNGQSLHENFMHKKIGNNSYTHSIYTRTFIWNCDIDLRKRSYTS